LVCLLILFFVVDFDGFNDGVLPGVLLLSCWRWSGFPVEVAVLFGPGFSAIILLFVFFNLLKIIYEREGIRPRAGEFKN
jgi:hypothetical protein